jgi:hypothetical protein
VISVNMATESFYREVEERRSRQAQRRARGSRGLSRLQRSILRELASVIRDRYESTVDDFEYKSIRVRQLLERCFPIASMRPNGSYELQRRSQRKGAPYAGSWSAVWFMVWH